VARYYPSDQGHLFLDADECSAAGAHSERTVGHRTAPLGTITAVPDEFDPQAMIERFRARAQAVRSRGLPPVEGPERQRFKEQAQMDFMDFAMMGDARAELEDGVLTLRIDLRPGGAADD
jgi:hypothetical protein